MAKVKSPIFSIRASGQLAKQLVYMTWKGINDVRQYVIPANPRTQKQQQQRGYFTQAVDKWHSVSWNSDDLSAWNLFATTFSVIMSGFNSFVKIVIDALRASKTFTLIYNTVISDITSSGATVEAKSSLSTDVKLYIGTSKTRLDMEVSGTYSEDTWTFTLTGLASNTKYYFTIKSKNATEVGRTGIYTFTTL